MNTQEYIASGVLEMYVSGQLSIEEMRDVELKACQYPEIKTELQTYQNALERFAMKHALAPPPELKDRIMKAIEGGRTVEMEFPASGEKKVSSRGLGYSRILAAAGIALLAVLSIVAFYFSSQYNRAKQEVADLESKYRTMESHMAEMESQMNKNTEQLHLITDANTIRVSMKGTEKSPQSQAVIYWNSVTKAVYLDVKSLPPLSPDKQYQLWAIDPAKGPVSAGVFDPKTGELIRMLDAETAGAFAVTLEPRGGSINPTLEQMYVIGNVTS